MKIILFLSLIFYFVSCKRDNIIEQGKDKFTNKTLESNNETIGNFNMSNIKKHLQEIFVTKINLNHKYHNHSQSIISYLSSLSNGINSNDQISSIEQDNNFLNELINEDREYMNNQYYNQKQNYDLVRKNLIEKMKNQVTLYKGEWSIKETFKMPFLNSKKGKIEFIFIYDKVYENDVNFYYSFNINLKILGDQISDISQDKFILAMKSSSQFTSLAEILYSEDNSFIFPLERYYFKETHLLQFNQIQNLLTGIHLKCKEENNTITEIEGTIDTDDFSIEFRGKYTDNIKTAFDKYNLLILANSIIQLLTNIYLTICLGKNPSNAKYVSYINYFRCLYF